MMNMEEEVGHLATGSESLAEFAQNAGMDNPDRPWLLDSRDVWVANPFYKGPEVEHPELTYFDYEQQPQPESQAIPSDRDEDFPILEHQLYGDESAEEAAAEEEIPF